MKKFEERTKKGFPLETFEHYDVAREYERSESGCSDDEERRNIDINNCNYDIELIDNKSRVLLQVKYVDNHQYIPENKYCICKSIF